MSSGEEFQSGPVCRLWSPRSGGGPKGEGGCRRGGLAEPWPLLYSQVGLLPETEKGWQVRGVGSPEARAVVLGERTKVSPDH